MKIALVPINKQARVIARKLKKHFQDATIIHVKKTGKKKVKDGTLQGIINDVFFEYKGIVFIAATGIVVRSIAPFIRNKYEDPAVVCVDTAGRYAISVLSGHEGGANQLTYKVAAAIDAEPIITTGTESHKKYIIGIGCRRGVSKKNIADAIFIILNRLKIDISQVRCVGTIDIKKDERGLLLACENFDVPLVFFTKKQIGTMSGRFLPSALVKRRIGVEGVCEPCALLAGRNTKIIVAKTIHKGVTAACAREMF